MSIADCIQISQGGFSAFILILYLEFRLVRYCKDNCKNYRKVD